MVEVSENRNAIERAMAAAGMPEHLVCNVLFNFDKAISKVTDEAANIRAGVNVLIKRIEEEAA